ncbi:MAG: transcription termination factor NusA [Oscillospiraceae bacterium]|jgi:N utilization substance protein A|nr:transcription termination factor NusA [Oscillospiraceae bacterium]
MGKEFFAALNMLQKEYRIPIDSILSKIKKSVLTACKANYESEDVNVDIDFETNNFEVSLNKTVRDVVKNKSSEISIEDAKIFDANVKVNDVVRIPLDTKDFSRIAAQTARSMLKQGIRDSEREQISKEFQNLQKEIVTATIENIDPANGAVVLKIGKAEAILVPGEQIGTEVFREGEHIKVYVLGLKETERGSKILISRTHPDFVKKLFYSEVPEIADSTIEIKAIAREAGSRTKVAVFSNDPNVEAVGACIGARGIRIDTIIDELGGEKVDVIEYSEDDTSFIAAALSPARVLNVYIKKTSPEEALRSCRVTVPDSQLSLAIGAHGQNVRLAARLTRYKIDIDSEVEENF